MTPTEQYNARFLTPAPSIHQEIESNVSNYIIWNPSSKLPPTVTHATRAAAIKVAGRMAGQYPGEKFFVAKLVNVAHKEVPKPQPEPTVQFTTLDGDEDVPF